MMMNFTFGNVNSADYGVWISGGGTFDAPLRDVSFINVPGRNGDILQDNERHNNISVTYPAWIARGFENRFNAFRAALLAQTGYCRLTDDYHPGEYRLAVFKDGISPAVGPRNTSGSFNLTFVAKPQRFLLSGEEEITIYPGSEGTSYIYSGYIPVSSSATVTADLPSIPEATFGVYLRWYDASKTSIRVENDTGTKLHYSVTGTKPENAAYVRAYISKTSPQSLQPFTVTVDGMAVTYIRGGAQIENPTLYVAEPTIDIYHGQSTAFTLSDGAAWVTLRRRGVTITDYSDASVFGAPPYVRLDSERANAYYYGPLDTVVPITINLNPYVTIIGDNGIDVAGSFPLLYPGTTTLALTTVGSMEKMVIRPRWWTL